MVSFLLNVLLVDCQLLRLLLFVSFQFAKLHFFDELKK